MRPGLLLAPLVPLLLGAATPGVVAADSGVDTAAMSEPLPVAEPPWRQVRILQQFSIRITPRAAMPPQMRIDLEQEEGEARFAERSIGKCLPVSQIAAAHPARHNRLLLILRDQRIVSAALEKACSSSEFYSGFYMARSADGQLCVSRDVLQSRTGASCKVKRWRELVAVDERRLP